MTNFFGLKVLEERESPINGKIQVVADILGRVSLRAGGLTQSGGVAEIVWRAAFTKLKSLNQKAENCLLLGVGGGTAARLVSEMWPGTRIIGVEIDPLMIELGKKYLELGEIANFEIKIADAIKTVSRLKRQKIQFDLILVDLYQQDKVPKEAEGEEFLKIVHDLAKTGGVCVFNRLFYNDKKQSAAELRQKLGRLFSSIIGITPEANILFICYP